jgi:hypothetical protein
MRAIRPRRRGPADWEQDSRREKPSLNEGMGPCTYRSPSWHTENLPLSSSGELLNDSSTGSFERIYPNCEIAHDWNVLWICIRPRWNRFLWNGRWETEESLRPGSVSPKNVSHPESRREGHLTLLEFVSRAEDILICMNRSTEGTKEGIGDDKIG